MRIDLRPPSDGAGIVIGDEGRLRQLLLILLDNAVKHAPPASAVELTVLRHERHLT